MDGILSGMSTLEEAKILQHQLTDIVKTAQMSLHKWCGNTSELIPTTKKEYEFSPTDEIKTLGIAWKAKLTALPLKREVCAPLLDSKSSGVDPIYPGEGKTTGLFCNKSRYMFIVNW
ncbi:hypothetical protein HNY73_010950 [Argiope bruennichi]|uniref:Uncharacterized protein n=1 Tax=Argiope bruennichi TaxID=94029 RepID=A0A8T0F2P4_ARGBR|nr:hypothetical protein HNY73_010950 [Argiope bruennichi]